MRIKESKEEKLLGVILDKTLCFKQQVRSICKKAGQKLHALSRISHFLDTEQLKRIMRAFILSQFNYCPLVWMFCNRTLDNKVNRIHERALRITYKDMKSDFDTMLLRDNAVTIHIRNLQLLMTEIYKTKWELNPTFMKEIFVEYLSNLFVKNSTRNVRELRNTETDLSLPLRKTKNGQKAISFRGPKLWNELELDLKQATSLATFKKRLKN